MATHDDEIAGMRPRLRAAKIDRGAVRRCRNLEGVAIDRDGIVLALRRKPGRQRARGGEHYRVIQGPLIASREYDARRGNGDEYLPERCAGSVPVVVEAGEAAISAGHGLFLRGLRLLQFLDLGLELGVLLPKRDGLRRAL